MTCPTLPVGTVSSKRWDTPSATAYLPSHISTFSITTKNAIGLLGCWLSSSRQRMNFINPSCQDGMPPLLTHWFLIMLALRPGFGCILFPSHRVGHICNVMNLLNKESRFKRDLHLFTCAFYFFQPTQTQYQSLHHPSSHPSSRIRFPQTTHFEPRRYDSA
jgi:hypothetical protein